jgi:hypothetical protein
VSVSANACPRNQLKLRFSVTLIREAAPAWGRLLSAYSDRQDAHQVAAEADLQLAALRGEEISLTRDRMISTASMRVSSRPSASCKLANLDR